MSRAATAFALASGLLAVAVASDSFWPAWRPGLAPFALLAVIVLLATGFGRTLAARLGLEEASESQKTLIGATLGLGALSLGGFALGAAGLFKPWAVSAFLGVLWLAGYAQLRPALESLAPDQALLRERPLAAAAVALPLFLALWLCLAPPHHYDSLVYHLALPEQYVLKGRLYAPQGTVYAHFPQNGEMLFTLALLTGGGDLLAPMFMWLATVLSIWWLFSLGRREAPMSAVALAAFLVATHTGLLLTASTTYVEPLVMLWTTAAVLAFERWRQLSGEGRSRGWLLLSALCTGLALGTKYYAGITAVVLGLRLLWRLRAAEGRPRAAAELALFTAVVTALFAPWMVKNWLCVRNPVFPFLYRWFENTGTGWDSDLAAGYFRVLTEYGHAGGFLRALLSLPILLLRNPLRFGGGMDVLGDLGWDLTLWLLPLGAWAARRNAFLRGLLVFCSLYALAWFSSGVVLRFLTVLMPLLALLGAVGLVRLREELGPWGRRATAAAVGVMTLSHLFLFAYVNALFDVDEAVLGIEDREVYLSRRLDYYPCAVWVREHAAPNDKILIVGEQRSYGLGRERVPSTVHMPNLYVRRANEAASAADLVARLRGEGFTHLMIVPREAHRLREALGDLTPQGAANWAGLEKDLVADFTGRACVVAHLGREAR